MFLGRVLQKYWLSELKLSLTSGFKKMDLSRISSIEVAVGNLLLVKCSQALSS